MNIFTQLKPEWHGTTPEELLDLPPTVLKDIDPPKEQVLNTVFGIGTLRDMANHPELDWVWRTFGLFRAGVLNALPEEASTHITEEWLNRSCGDWLRSPIRSLKTITEETAPPVSHKLGWATVRDIASDPSFNAARAIHRYVTGEPVPPEESADKPLKNYFEGAVSNYKNRKREAAGIPAPPPPPPAAPEEAPPAAPPPPPGAGGTHGVAPLQTSPFITEIQNQSAERRLKDYTPSGAYIPKGGGSRGWFENKGVAKTERGNNYSYQFAIDTQGYRSVAVEQKVAVNLRGAERKDVRMQVRYVVGDAAPFPAICLNISLTGAKIRVGSPFSPDQPIIITFVHRDPLQGSELPFLQLESRVVWCNSVDKRYKTQRYDCGLEFQDISIDNKERLSMVLMDQLDDLLAEVLPEQDEYEL